MKTEQYTLSFLGRVVPSAVFVARTIPIPPDALGRNIVSLRYLPYLSYNELVGNRLHPRKACLAGVLGIFARVGDLLPESHVGTLAYTIPTDLANESSLEGKRRPGSQRRYGGQNGPVRDPDEQENGDCDDEVQGPPGLVPEGKQREQHRVAESAQRRRGAKGNTSVSLTRSRYY